MLPTLEKEIDGLETKAVKNAEEVVELTKKRKLKRAKMSKAVEDFKKANFVGDED
jgi:DNA-binding MarR family transcriptional regulator